MDLVNEQIGAEGKVEIKFSQGKLLVSVVHEHKSGKISLQAEENIEYFGAKLKEVIKGKVDDAIIDLIIASVKALP